MAFSYTLNQFSSVSKNTTDFIQNVDRSVNEMVKVLSLYPSLIDEQSIAPSAKSLFAEIMVNNPLFYAAYIGLENGDFYQLINLNSSNTARKQLNATDEDRWLLVEIRGQGDQRQKLVHYTDKDFNIRATQAETSRYDPRQRLWYQHASNDEVYKTSPYMFDSLKAPGQTYAVRFSDSNAVIGIDIALSSLSRFFYKYRIGNDSQIYLYKQSGEVIASSLIEHGDIDLADVKPLALTESEQALVAKYPLLKVSNELDWIPIDYAVSGKPKGYSIDFLKILSALTGISLQYENGYAWTGLVDYFKAGKIDVLQPAFKTAATEDLGLYSKAFIDIPYALVTSTRHANMSALDQMAGRKLGIPEGWSVIEAIKSQYPDIEVVEVASPHELLVAVKNGVVDAGLDTELVLRFTAKQYFIDGLQFTTLQTEGERHLPSELYLMVREEHAELLPLLNRAIDAVTTEQRELLKNKWLNMAYDQAVNVTTVPHKALIELTQNEQNLGKIHEMTLSGMPYLVYIDSIGKADSETDFLAMMIPTEEVYAPALEKVRLSIGITILFLLILAPFPWLFASPIVTPIRKLADEHEKIERREFDDVVRLESHIKEIDDLGRSMMEMLESIKQYEENQQALMDAFIQLIAQAIDDKSPYTAGHCERVPELAFMLTEKAEKADFGLFEHFHFESEKALREFKVGAWLHDCGKITTPEHIVDKGSKLETIYNRIHEIRTRFEVLLRDAELDFWRQCHAEPEREAEWREALKQKQAQIKEDFAFVASVNVGGEFLSDDKKERLKEIATQQWTRHLDDRLGLSPLEETRINTPAVDLPVQESLLMDKPEHLFERLHSVEYDPKLGIKMDVPHYLYNTGELYNLLIERGTLTAEDRFKINEHIISTIRMLDSLPLPDELAKVPQYASTHHETLIGTGYPRRLKADDLSVPERIMVLADIYEALTAADRPYKKAKPLSVAIDILYKMVEDQHVDREVFELFLTSGVYLDYARKYLQPKQIDEVDISQYLNQ
jgi:HD-GYP domain-containing protein (c-di-GMP phosphodiesterase class II)/ABC-type amino acid transport substrate-binding protein